MHSSISMCQGYSKAKSMNGKGMLNADGILKTIIYSIYLSCCNSKFIWILLIVCVV